ncbi:2-dehydropantoate 2-reductase [Bacillus sp. B190/17]|uniref:2-dehydropantoate 2-reductase n=1 Tax=Bacillus lumedeiriae TaxID=3058829 RepID=A0ABW8I8B2_9BACI
MKIGIVGGGAVGLYFAASLAEWFPVTIFTRTEEQSAVINERGIVLREGDEETAFFVQARPIDQLTLHSPECLFIAVKQYNLASLLPILNKMDSHPALVFLQNGMGHLTQMKQLIHPHIFVAAVEHGILKSGSARVDIRGRGKTNVAVYRGSCQVIKTVTEQTAEVFPFEWRRNYESMLLRKMAANTVINPLTAMLNIRNGELIANPHYLRIAKMIYKEFSSVFANQVHAETWSEIVHICRTTAANRSSMLRDIESGRPTEVDAIVGYVLLQASEKNIRVPVLEALYEMIKGLEHE